jgi:hypothetical protein
MVWGAPPVHEKAKTVGWNRFKPSFAERLLKGKMLKRPELEFLNNLWGLGTE